MELILLQNQVGGSALMQWKTQGATKILGLLA